MNTAYNKPFLLMEETVQEIEKRFGLEISSEKISDFKTKLALVGKRCGYQKPEAMLLDFLHGTIPKSSRNALINVLLSLFNASSACL